MCLRKQCQQEFKKLSAVRRHLFFFPPQNLDISFLVTRMLAYTLITFLVWMCYLCDSHQLVLLGNIYISSNC